MNSIGNLAHLISTLRLREAGHGRLVWVETQDGGFGMPECKISASTNFEADLTNTFAAAP